ncbi:uncharacterized protein METZ01_LOCUS93523, partial [marine metagenome]
MLNAAVPLGLGNNGHGGRIWVQKVLPVGVALGGYAAAAFLETAIITELQKFL